EMINGVAHPELYIRGDLIIAAASGVQLAADVGQALDESMFDVRVDVFQLAGERKLATRDFAGDVIQRGDNPLRLVGTQEADFGEHPRVRLAGGDVVAIQPLIDAD